MVMGTVSGVFICGWDVHCFAAGVGSVQPGDYDRLLFFLIIIFTDSNCQEDELDLSLQV